MLLGSKGVSVPKTAQRLEALRTTTRSLEPLEPVGDTDIHGFLKNERENSILSVIEETKKNSFAMVEKLHWETMFNDWEVEKQKILQVHSTCSRRSLQLDVRVRLYCVISPSFFP